MRDMDKLDKFARDLQEAILKDEKKKYSEKVVQLWLNPENVRRMTDPDGAALMKGVCGDTVEIYLSIRNNKIYDASFFTDGCGPTVACGSLVTELVKGKSIEDALKLSPASIIDALDGLPEENIHCAILAINTLHKAIADYLLKNF
ncbi:MAG: hypothetical protein A7316_00655 [Candidatus Altiarchaeales archaeon WOR_SM1_86-2]|nr:MAG: hypothetical protein A7315_05425 [Candidatus Altiarchaeales archaeon WOR_SM1_79]ODS39018.1 MAG: hypothetical protein A7316_00655 [Candidatus Altiarchaeales archaeon WOR_SM1_86-2]